MLCRKMIQYWCSESVSKSVQLLRKLQVAQGQSEDLRVKLIEIEEEVKQKQKQLNIRNKQIQQLRTQMTRDIEKGEKLRAEAKKKTEIHRAQAIQNFAEGLIKICPCLQKIEQAEQEIHQKQFVQLKEGFDLTSRLFFSTLEKYKIHRISGKVGEKLDGQRMEVVEEEEMEEKERKNTVAQVVEDGWTAEGKVIRKLKVRLYR